VSTTTNAPADLRRRNRRFGIFALFLAAFAGAVFATGVEGLSATFQLNDVFGAPTYATLPAISVPVAPTALFLALVIAGVGLYQAVRGFGERGTLVVSILVGLFVLAFLTWAARGQQLQLLALLRGTMRAAVPLALGALSGVLCERAGVINIAIEGQFLAAAFTAAVVSSVSGDPWIGLVAGVLAGGLVGGLLAVLSIRYRADQIVVGVVLIVLATGLTSFLTSQLLSGNPGLNSPRRFRSVTIAVLGDLPLIGPLLFRHSVTVYLMLAVVILVQVALFRTRWGLRLRAVGEHPKAADTVGIRVLATRYRAVILGGMVAGIGGAYFTLDATGQFSREMSGGRGFIALAAMLVGRYSPAGALGAALIFGFADALATSLQILNVGIPSTLLLTAPYVVTILVVAGLVGRLRMPAADGQPYVKEG
jgi:ABC-type uncharacterized transport system permease subunit